MIISKLRFYQLLASLVPNRAMSFVIRNTIQERFKHLTTTKFASTLDTLTVLEFLALLEV